VPKFTGAVVMVQLFDTLAVTVSDDCWALSLLSAR